MGFKTNLDQISPALPFSFCQLLSPTVPFIVLTLIQSVSHPWRSLPLGVFPLLPLLQESFSSPLPHVLQVSPYGAGFLLLLQAFFEYLWMLFL